MTPPPKLLFNSPLRLESPDHPLGLGQKPPAETNQARRLIHTPFPRAALLSGFKSLWTIEPFPSFQMALLGCCKKPGFDSIDTSATILIHDQWRESFKNVLSEANYDLTRKEKTGSDDPPRL
jgi:hypothetical protein